MTNKHLRKAIDGILLLDKPTGISSAQAVNRVKYLLNATKAGHTGTLDPLATGLLPICLGEATKFSAFALNGRKRYQARIKLGIATDTDDSTGKIVKQQSLLTFNWQAVEPALAQFRGEIWQLPPMFSALKQQGQPLYRLARAGLSVERAFRLVSLYNITLLAIDPINGDLDLDISCSKGTYIRALARDFGQKLGCGAHLTVLRRLACGPFSNQQPLVELTQLTTQSTTSLLAVDSLLKHLPALELSTRAAQALRFGQAWRQEDINFSVGQLFRAYCQQQLVGLVELKDSVTIIAKRLLRTA